MDLVKAFSSPWNPKQQCSTGQTSKTRTFCVLGETLLLWEEGMSMLFAGVDCAATILDCGWTRTWTKAVVLPVRHSETLAWQAQRTLKSPWSKCGASRSPPRQTL